MPWHIESEDGQYCVYKDEGGVVACHDTREDAEAQLAALYASEKRYTVKAAGDWELEVLGAPFGSAQDRDSDGEWFAPDTRFHEDKFPLPPIVYYHGYDPQTKKPTGQPEYIGQAVSREVKSDGVWYRVVLNKTSELAARVWAAAKQGAAVASSGSLAHLVRKAADGMIREWPIAELSIWDNDGTRPQANRHAIALPVLKMMYEQAGITPPDYITQASQVDGTGEEQKPTTAQATNTEQSTVKRKSTMNEIEQAVQAALKAEREAQAAAAKFEQEKQEAVQSAVAAAKAQWEQDAAKSNRLPGAVAPAVVDSSLWKYDGLSAGDLALGLQVLRDAQKRGFSSGASDAAVKALAMRLESDECKAEDGYREARWQMRKSVPSSIKANEIMQSTLASYGDEWVGVAYGTALWNTIRQGTEILRRQMVYAVPQPAGAETMVFPLEGSDPIWYKTPQAADLTANPGGIPTMTVTASKMGTAQQSRTMAKISARVPYTQELEEDAVVNVASELRRQLAESGMEMLESLIINGDTATGNQVNINDIGGQPAGTEFWLSVNGYRKLALVTNTANSRDGGVLAEDDFLETIKLMGLGGRNVIGSDRVAFISDLYTYWKALDLTSVKTRDVNSAATVETGNLVRMWGYDYLASRFMHDANQDATYGLKANVAGKLDLDTASNNTKGALLAVRFDQWRPGYRRQMTTETVRYAASDSYEIVAHLRFGMVYRDIEAAAITYNLTV